MDFQKSFTGVNTAQISSNHGELLGVVGMAQLILVNIGEDILSKIMAFLQQGSTKFRILSATGDVCSVSLRKSAIGDDIVTHEGQFVILSLSGSFMLSESSRTCGLHVLLSRPDHSFFGGYVAGMLMAATPVQVVVSSFIPKMENPETKGYDDAPKGTIRLVDPSTTE